MESENRGIPIICCGSFLEDKYFENARKIVNEAFHDFEERLIRLEAKVQAPNTTQTEPKPTTSGGKENEKDKKDDKKEEEKKSGQVEEETKGKQSEVTKKTPETTNKYTEESTQTENAAKTKEEAAELKTLEEKTSKALLKADAAAKKVEKALLPFEDWAELISLHNRFYDKNRDDIVNQVIDSLLDEPRSDQATTLHFEEVTLEEDNFEAVVDVSGIPIDKIRLDVMDNIIEVSASHTEINALGSSTKRINKRYQLPRNVDDTSLTAYLSRDGVLLIFAPLKQYLIEK